jgi:O-methyltransferase involved in polyketide biosynthesis
MVFEADKIRVDLTGAPETMLATLCAKALDADARDPILGDTFAEEMVGRIDLTGAAPPSPRGNAPSVATRTAREFTGIMESAMRCNSTS